MRASGCRSGTASRVAATALGPRCNAAVHISRLKHVLDLVPARCLFFFQAEDGIRDVAVTGVQTCALPISCNGQAHTRTAHEVSLIFSPIEFVKDHGLLKIVDPGTVVGNAGRHRVSGKLGGNGNWLDRKSTRLNSSHGYISYAVFCLKKKNII